MLRQYEVTQVSTGIHDNGYGANGRPAAQLAAAPPLAGLTNVSCRGSDDTTRGGGPRQHVFYLKTHKTGSTTMYSILAEYCRSRELFPLLPRGNHINLHGTFKPWMLSLIPGVSKYDMVFNHHIFHPDILKYLHDDTFKVTTVREPLQQFTSSFTFFSQFGEDFPYLAKIPGPDKISTFLSNPEKYEGKGTESYTNNRQSIDLGFDYRHYRFNDTNYIKSFVANVEKYFDLVLITDYFDESLVLLKRLLRWTTQDILFFKKHNQGHPRLSVSPQQMEQHKRHSMADRALYDHFLPIFKALVSKHPDLMGEVEEFRQVLAKVGEFCGSTDRNWKQLIILAGRWTDQVSILRSKCKWLKLDEVSFTNHLKAKETELLKDG
ncbi:galactose-3-O-sulfotransferase 2-like [Aplysia californica]|uniref:Galactose-3-O-sulfotransferase 2-like n=1 Tax=Aplysia californica TaxID=6500 RepID=A0ABM0JK45_APLCA|nr:galactose-3-O-sulfotransferase 2-like [Aplysia californica]